MPGFGIFGTYPRRMGGGFPRPKYILDALNAARGTAYDVTSASPVYIENLAAARALAESWSTNQRLANNFISTKVTDFLDRWEKICALPKRPELTAADRRARLKKKRLLFSTPAIASFIAARLGSEMASVFVSLEHIGISVAVVHVPDGSYPFGTVSTDTPWSSTVAKLLVRTQKPTGWTLGQFFEAVKQVFDVVDGIIPAWCTLDWYMSPSVGTPIDVADGPSGVGFYLDEPNLDLEVFDT